MTGWTEADVQRVMEGRTPASVRGRGVHKPGVMNNTEAAYAERLEMEKMTKGVAWYAFEAITFKLAKDTRYTPDFAVMYSGGELEFHEVKGFFRDDAKVKIRVASSLFPFMFRLVKAIPKKMGGGFTVEAI